MRKTAPTAARRRGVVGAAVTPTGLRQARTEEERCWGAEGLRLGLWCGCPPLTPLFIGEGARGAGPLGETLEGGRRPKGEGKEGRLAPQARGAPPLGFPPPIP